jgi:hypothetical protein
MLVVFVLVLKVNQSDNLYQATNLYMTLILMARYRLSDWFTFKTNTTNISPYAYTLYMMFVAWYRLSDWFAFRTSTNTTNISPYTY